MLLKLTANAPRNREQTLVFDPDLRLEVPHTWIDFDTIEVPDAYGPSVTITHLNLPRSLANPEGIAARKRAILLGH